MKSETRSKKGSTKRFYTEEVKLEVIQIKLSRDCQCYFRMSTS